MQSAEWATLNMPYFTLRKTQTDQVFHSSKSKPSHKIQIIEILQALSKITPLPRAISSSKVCNVGNNAGLATQKQSCISLQGLKINNPHIQNLMIKLRSARLLHLLHKTCHFQRILTLGDCLINGLCCCVKRPSLNIGWEHCNISLPRRN